MTLRHDITSFFFDRRYDVEITSDFPEKSERCVYFGKVAEDTQKVYLDLDQLTRHTVIAGITGGGKTIAGNVIVEDALANNIAVLVIDPTAQWTGIIKENTDLAIKREYDRFGMHNDQTRGLPTRLIAREAMHEALDLDLIFNPGIATVLSVEHLTPIQIEEYICNLMQRIRARRLEPSKHLRWLIVFDEIHVILPKFGGSGEGFNQIERATREFRELGIGLLLLSQVLEDFIGAIRGNVNTELQMRTTFDEDLEKARLKYTDRVANSIMAAQTGTGLFHNAEYNRGKPFFLCVRPPTHNTQRLTTTELNEYTAIADTLRALRGHVKGSRAEYYHSAEQNLLRGKYQAAKQYIELLRN